MEMWLLCVGKEARPHNEPCLLPGFQWCRPPPLRGCRMGSRVEPGPGALAPKSQWQTGQSSAFSSRACGFSHAGMEPWPLWGSVASAPACVPGIVLSCLPSAVVSDHRLYSSKILSCHFDKSYRPLPTESGMTHRSLIHCVLSMGGGEKNKTCALESDSSY